jgi:hypothetical protein
MEWMHGLAGFYRIFHAQKWSLWIDIASSREALEGVMTDFVSRSLHANPSQ